MKNKTDNKIKENTFIYLKGFLMGVCDIVPGISGGTIAFITGIYIRLIDTIKNLSGKKIFKLLGSVFKLNINNIKKQIKELDLIFLSILLTGILSAIFLVSKLITYLLENYIVSTLSFFIGLIIASSTIIFDDIENHKKKEISFGIIGFVFGIILLFITPLQVLEPSYSYVILGGFIAISALFLPGVSGSFILLIMGLYKFILESIHNIKERLDYLLAFGVGAILGAIFISRAISYLYSKDKSKTLYTLLGIVLGSLTIPIRTILEEIENYSLITILNPIIFLIIGIVIVISIKNYSQKKRKKQIKKISE